MDIDAFSALRGARWKRLETLARSRKRTGAEADEMALLYRSTATDLSAVRSAAPEPALIIKLSMLLATSRVWLAGSHRVRSGDVSRYFARSLPAAMFRVRWWGVSVALAVVVMGTISGIHTYNSPEALELVGNYETRQTIAEQEFESYYSDYDSASFGAQVWTNNAWLAAQCIAGGFTGIFPAFVMYNTILQLGIAGAIMAEFGMLDIFFKLILPHGLLELSAVFVAAGAGLKVFWTILVPGPLPRGQALAQVFRTLVSVAGGLAIALLVSGILEGFVTPSELPSWFKILIGSIATVAFWAYVVLAGRIATWGGASGDTERDFTAEQAPVAA